jgi:hypothetical protein
MFSTYKLPPMSEGKGKGSSTQIGPPSRRWRSIHDHQTMTSCNNYQPPTSITANHTPAALPHLHHRHPPRPITTMTAINRLRVRHHTHECDDYDATRHAPSAEEAATCTCRTTQGLQGGRPRWPGLRRTPAMEVANAPMQRGPSPHQRSHRHCVLHNAEEVEVTAARHYRSSVEGCTKSILPCPRSNYLDHRSITRTGEDTTRRRVSTKLPTVGRSAWGKGNDPPPPSTCPRTPAAWHSTDD